MSLSSRKAVRHCWLLPTICTNRISTLDRQNHPNCLRLLGCLGHRRSPIGGCQSKSGIQSIGLLLTIHSFPKFNESDTLVSLTPNTILSKRIRPLTQCCRHLNRRPRLGRSQFQRKPESFHSQHRPPRKRRTNAREFLRLPCVRANQSRILDWPLLP